MANIELFDKYINSELSDSERNVFKERLESDKEFATDFNIYMVSVIGICKEAEQDDMDFGVAMKNLSKEQLYEIIGRKSGPISQEDIINRLQHRIALNDNQSIELSNVAALDDIDDDDYSADNQEDMNSPKGNASKEDSDNSLRTFTYIFIAIIIIIIIISVFL